MHLQTYFNALFFTFALALAAPYIKSNGNDSNDKFLSNTGRYDYDEDIYRNWRQSHTDYVPGQSLPALHEGNGVFNMCPAVRPCAITVHATPDYSSKLRQECPGYEDYSSTGVSIVSSTFLK